MRSVLVSTSREEQASISMYRRGYLNFYRLQFLIWGELIYWCGQIMALATLDLLRECVKPPLFLYLLLLLMTWMR